MNPMHVLATMAKDPSISTRATANARGPSQPTVQILHEHEHKSYHGETHQELRLGDFTRWYEFTTMALECRDVNPNFCQKIFSLMRLVSQNTFPLITRTINWGSRIPTAVSQYRTQFPDKLNVWAGFVGQHVFHPVFIPVNLAGKKYRNYCRERSVTY